MMKTVVVMVSLCLALFSDPVRGEVINGGFETGDFTGWHYSFPFVPLGAMVTNSVLSLENGSTTPFNWLPTEGSHFAYLWSGWSFNGAHVTACLSPEPFLLQTTEQLEFDFFFDAGDAMPNNDFGSFSISVSNESQGFGVESRYFVLDVGDYGDTGWMHINFNSPLTGVATMQFCVGDTGADYVHYSAIGVDNVRVVPEPTTCGLLATGFLLTLRRKK